MWPLVVIGGFKISSVLFQILVFFLFFFNNISAMLYTIMHFLFVRSTVVLCEKARSNELSTNNPTFLGIESKGTR
jgi:hypothetical protein